LNNSSSDKITFCVQHCPMDNLLELPNIRAYWMDMDLLHFSSDVPICSAYTSL